ncbi:porin [Uliginosibacterium sp. H3]|uniref:Porin n=1 Tax=Uliginosibacterium silvisoli TaxID=3114758 RepID=A0ABU6K2U8_9RHOO|nr:porin [Uliginosibacterium sp. H3]
MQKKLIALAVAGLMSGAAFAQTSVTIGGKFDAGYQFKRTSKADTAAGGPNGGSTTETLGDGAASTSRITVGAKETLSPGWEAGVSLDLRFGTIEEGKGFTQDSTKTINGQGGINSNDKKALYLTTPIGTVQWGVINAGDNFYLAEKPYMVSPKDLEIVKYGIATYRITALTSRVTDIRTPTINMGPVGLLFKGQYAFGDNRKSGDSNISAANSGDALSGGFEYKVGDVVNGGFDYLHRTPSTNGGTVPGVTAVEGFNFWRFYTSVMPVKGLKIAGTYIDQRGYGQNTVNSQRSGWADKVTNAVISYNLNDKLEIGAEYSIVRDVGEFRNSGHGYMFGGAYFLSKNTYIYAAFQKADWQSNASAYGGKYDGTAPGFSGTASKVDSNYTRFGLVKEF